MKFDSQQIQLKKDIECECVCKWRGLKNKNKKICVSVIHNSQRVFITHPPLKRHRAALYKNPTMKCTLNNNNNKMYVQKNSSVCVGTRVSFKLSVSLHDVVVLVYSCCTLFSVGELKYWFYGKRFGNKNWNHFFSWRKIFRVAGCAVRSCLRKNSIFL